MGSASAKAVVSNPNNSNDVNTNIFIVNFKFLEQKIYSIHSGSNTKCSGCSAYLSNLSASNLYKNTDASKSNAKVQPYLEQLSASQSVWQCEYCGVPNIVSDSALTSLPKNDFILYKDFFENNKKQPSNQMEVEEEEHKSNDINKAFNLQGEQLIYVLDNSGSMSSMETYKKNGEKVVESRKKSVIAAIREQSAAFETIPEGEAQKDISLVIFSNSVDVYPKAGELPEVIQGGCLDSWDLLLARVSNLQERMVGSSPKEIGNLLEIYRKSNKMGSTALGPAVLASIEVAKANHGSQVIVCTDGMANVGLGKFEGNNKAANTFFDSVADYAKGKGVQVSVLAIGVGLDTVGRLAERTNGSVFKIDLENLNSKLDNILSDKIIGSDAKLKLILHNHVYLDQDGNTDLEIDVGNATRETCLTFEYLFKGDLPKDITQVPFQAQIEYTDLNNERQFIVVSKSIEITNNRKAVENDLKMEFVEKRMAQKSANLVEKGDYLNANNYQMQWANVVQNNSNYSGFQYQQQQQQQIIQNYTSNSAPRTESMQAQMQQMRKGKFY